MGFKLGLIAALCLRFIVAEPKNPSNHLTLLCIYLNQLEFGKRSGISMIFLITVTMLTIILPFLHFNVRIFPKTLDCRMLKEREVDVTGPGAHDSHGELTSL